MTTQLPIRRPRSRRGNQTLGGSERVGACDGPIITRSGGRDSGVLRRIRVTQRMLPVREIRGTDRRHQRKELKSGLPSSGRDGG